MNKKCQTCQTYNPENALFCKNCGTKLIPEEKKEDNADKIVPEEQNEKQGKYRWRWWLAGISIVLLLAVIGDNKLSENNAIKKNYAYEASTTIFPSPELCTAEMDAIYAAAEADKNEGTISVLDVIMGGPFMARHNEFMARQERRIERLKELSQIKLDYKALLDNPTEASCTEAIGLDPEDAYAYTIRGNVYRKFKEHLKAIQDYTKAIELNPNIAYTYAARGDAYRKLKEYPKAIQDGTKAIELDGNYTYAYTFRGDVYRELKQYSKAVQDYTKAIELDANSTYTYAYIGRGGAYRDLKVYKNARNDFTRACELGSCLRFELFYNNLMMLVLKVGFSENK